MVLRKVRVVFDCLYCGNRLAVREVETDQADTALQKMVVHDAVCRNPRCPETGKPQEAMYPRVEAAA